MGVGTNLRALQIAPLVAHGAQLSGAAVGLGHLDGLGQGSLVVDIKGDEHVLVVQDVLHLLVGPYCGLHLAAVDTAETSEIYHHRFTFGTCGGHAQFKVLVFGFHTAFIKVEILGVHGRREGTDSLEWCAPQTRYHIDGKGQRHPSEEELRNVGAVSLVIVWELQPA